MRNILIIGGSGILGTDALNYFSNLGFNILNPYSSVLDITSYDKVKNYFDSHNQQIDVILLSAAYTKVDLAETEIERAFLVNHYGAMNISTFAKLYDIPLIYISTDYIFAGDKNTPYLPSDVPNPLNVYGRSKLAGEQVIQLICHKFYIVRTSWLYGLTGKNFVSTILHLINKQDHITVVNDQIGCPTFSYHLLQGIYTLIRSQAAYGIYHICSAGAASWFEFAQLIVSLANKNINVVPISTDVLKLAAARPKYSVMDCNNMCPSWQEGLKSYFTLINT